jgi:hypothetical protein
MVAEPKPRPNSIQDCLAKLGILTEEESQLPKLRAAKEAELEKARSEGNYGWAAQLMAELDDLGGASIDRPP